MQTQIHNQILKNHKYISYIDFKILASFTQVKMIIAISLRFPQMSECKPGISRLVVKFLCVLSMASLNTGLLSLQPSVYTSCLITYA